nr:2931_t:CDS:2 [Entrophospora candida]
MIISIREIYQQPEKLSQLAQIKVGGWAKSVRESKDIIFIILNDGTTLTNLQVVISKKFFSQLDLLEKVNFGSSLLVNGKLLLTPQRKQPCELQVTEIELINPVADDYPLQKKNIPLEVVRNTPHLRAKTNYFLALFRLRHSISKALHDFFHQEGFYYVPTPIITSNDAEGAGEIFNLTTNEKEPFFSIPAKLTVSGQLQAEALVQGLGKIYTFGPCFRAEKSHTTRHLAEFWMVEPEMIFTDLDGIISLAERLIKHVIGYVLSNNSSELKFLEIYDEQKKKEIITKLKKIAGEEFEKIDYSEVIELLEKNKENFVFKVGELIGGSMRDDRYLTLQARARKVGLDIKNLSWYFDLRKCGYAPSGGFGLGLERLIMFISGTENIRDTIAFPRFPGKLEF